MFLDQHFLAHKSNLATICNTNPTWPLYRKTNVTLVTNIWHGNIIAPLYCIQFTNYESSFTSIHVLTYYNILSGKSEI